MDRHRSDDLSGDSDPPAGAEPDRNVTAERVDRGINVVLVAVAMMTACSLALLAVAVPAVFSSRDNSSQVREGNELSGCRGAYSAEMVAGLAEIIIIQSEGLEAVVLEDDEAVDRAVVRLHAARDTTVDAKARYLDAVRRAGEDPEGFLKECRR